MSELLDPMGIVSHTFYNGVSLPEKAGMYGYVVDGNGVWIRAENSLMSVVVPVSSGKIRGLPCLFNGEGEPRKIEMTHAKLPSVLLQSMVEHGRDYPNNEVTYQVMLESSMFNTRLVQVGSKAGSGDFLDFPGHVILQAHTHNTMNAYWSGTDNANELEFRWYMVIGNVDLDRPTVRLRLGVYGYHVEVPLKTLFSGDTSFVTTPCFDMSGAYKGDVLR